MIGKLTWVGHVTCNDCPTQETDIHWGEARKHLRRKFWRHDGKVWRCPACHVNMQTSGEELQDTRL